MKTFKILTTSTTTRRYIVKAKNKEEIEDNRLTLHMLNTIDEDIIDIEGESIQVIQELEG